MENFLIRAGFNVRQRAQHWCEILHNRVVLVGEEYDDSDFPAGKVLLMPDALIAGQKHIKSGALRRVEQLAIAQLMPAVLVSC
jgi:hypothetical protein